MKKIHQYRPDVDGLRALAVLPVLFFHAGIGCPGGFVGVDIFFVISGFLITSLILEEIQDGAFTLARFWERRIRRILPAATLVLMTILLAGWFLFCPDDFEMVAQSVIAQIFLLSNVFFLWKVNYFAPGDASPLLHTWSLAVEEQFYLIFPFVLVFLARQKRISPPRTIFFLWLGFFLLSVAGSYVARRMTYFVLPTRAFELLTGAWLATLSGRKISSPAWNEAFGLAGLGLILGSVFLYNDQTRFPGLAAAAPCAGAGLIIATGGARATATSRLLAWPPVVWIGLISYSLYLWHWPLLVFARYASKDPLSWPCRLGLLAASVVLAALSWWWVETPFRKRRIWPRASQAFAFAAVSQLALLALAALIVWTHGAPARLPAQALKYYASRNDYAFRNEISPATAAAGQFPELGSPGTNQTIDILLWGDSHAMAVAPVIDALCRRYAQRGAEATHSMTAPILGYDSKSMFQVFHEDENSLAFSQSVGDFILQKHIKTVILAASWNIYDPPELVSAKLAATIHTLRAGGARVYVLRDVPAPGFNVPRFAAMTIRNHGDLTGIETPREKYAADNEACEPMFQQAALAGATVLDPSPYFLNRRGAYDIARGETLFYWDANHLTVQGALLLYPLFEPLFRHH